LERTRRRRNWGARFALEVFQGRLGLVTRQLARSSYMAGDAFTAADISVTYPWSWPKGEAALPSAKRNRLMWPACPD